MICIICWLKDPLPQRTPAEVVVNGHAVCGAHVPWAIRSCDINVIMRHRAKQLGGTYKQLPENGK
jgi:hypothetical protein